MDERKDHDLDWRVAGEKEGGFKDDVLDRFHVDGEFAHALVRRAATIKLVAGEFGSSVVHCPVHHQGENFPMNF